MKHIFILSLFCLTLLASSLQEASSSFSFERKNLLLQKFKNSTSPLHKSPTYDLKKGWNTFSSPLAGVDVAKTFSDASKIESVVTYDEVSQLWAIYSTKENYSPKKMLFLKYLEPSITFFVLAKANAKVNIKSKKVNSTCQKFMDNDDYDVVMDSGIDKKETVSKDEKLSLSSRYYSHHERGIYNDTRIALIYPKLTTSTKRVYKYGPAQPKMAIMFTKDYEGKNFYAYDFKDEKCYIGMFPSMKRPPAPFLKEL